MKLLWYTRQTMIQTLTLNTWSDYELLDSGNGRKLERFGKYTLIRPENEALWKPSLGNNDWQKAAAVYEKRGDRGEWKNFKNIPSQWEMSCQNLKCYAKLTPFGHTGVFPEQIAHWIWIQEKIKEANKSLKVLSLFTYTGLSTLAAAAAGASVTHVDASGPAVTWARDNARLSGLEQKPIRWIVDDAQKFVSREIRRGNNYDSIIMDPPKFGRGPKGEIWKFEESLPQLLDSCKRILNPNPTFIILTAYAIPVSSQTLSNLLAEITPKEEIEYGELTLQEKSGRLLSAAIFARWNSN